MYFLDDIELLQQLISQGDWACLPTDAGWCACALHPSNIDIESESESKIEELDDWTCLVADTMMFKAVVPDLHPRIDTLLSLHRKPLSLYFKDSDVQVVRIATHPLIKHLIQTLDQPIWAKRLYDSGQAVLNFEDIPMSILKVAAYVSSDKSKKDFELPVLASYNHKANLKFIRE